MTSHTTHPSHHLIHPQPLPHIHTNNHHTNHSIIHSIPSFDNNTNSWGIPPDPIFVHLITIEFPHDSGKSKLASLSSHCSFISLAQRKGTKETSPNQGLPPREGCNLLRAETALRKGFGKFYEASALKGKTCIDYLIVSE